MVPAVGSTAVLASKFVVYPPPALNVKAETSKADTPKQPVPHAVGSSHLAGLAALGALPVLAGWGRRLSKLGSVRGSRVVVRATAAQAGDSEQDNGLEEFLLGLNLPQPLRPILGSQAWSNFTAALLQFALVAGLGAGGTLLEQGEPASFYAQKYPVFSGVILTLGFDHMYTAPLFVGLLIWLAASLAACTGTTQLPMAKIAQRIRFRSAKAMRRLDNFLVKVDCKSRADPEAETATERPAPCEEARVRLKGLHATLVKRGFAVRLDSEAEPTQLTASRGLLGKFAPMFVHLALLLCLAGGAVGILFGASSEVFVKDGGQADLGQVLEQGRRAKGPLYAFFNPGRDVLRDVLVQCEDFRIVYRDDGEVDQFYSDLTLVNAKTEEKVFSDEIYVNKPLRYGGATVYQADWALDRLQLFVNGYPTVVPLKPLPGDFGVRVWGAFLPKEFVTAEDPSKVKQIQNPNDGIVFVLENMRNVQVYGMDKQLAGILRSPTAKVEKKMQGMPVQFGEEITVEGTAKLKLDKIVGKTGLIVKSDPGVPLVYLGFAVLMPATLLSVLPFGQVWATLGEGEDEGQLLISGRANRNQPSFEDELKAIVLSGSF